MCSKNIIKGSYITELKCKKHIYHYSCLIRWVRQNQLNKTNFFCPLCQGEEIQNFSRTIISKDDIDKLLTNNKSAFSNNKEILEQKSELENINKIQKDEKIEDEKIENKKENIENENSNMSKTNNIENKKDLFWKNSEGNDIKKTENDEEDKKD